MWENIIAALGLILGILGIIMNSPVMFITSYIVLISVCVISDKKMKKDV